MCHQQSKICYSGQGKIGKKTSPKKIILHKLLVVVSVFLFCVALFNLTLLVVVLVFGGHVALSNLTLEWGLLLRVTTLWNLCIAFQGLWWHILNTFTPWGLQLHCLEHSPIGWSWFESYKYQHRRVKVLGLVPSRYITNVSCWKSYQSEPLTSANHTCVPQRPWRQICDYYPLRF